MDEKEYRGFVGFNMPFGINEENADAFNTVYDQDKKIESLKRELENCIKYIEVLKEENKRLVALLQERSE
jgi:hypothetical protein